MSVLPRPAQRDPLLADGLLEGRVVVLCDVAPGLSARVGALGAMVEELEPGAGEEVAAAHVGDVLGRHEAIHALVVGTAGGVTDVPEVLDRTWVAVRAVATAAMVPESAGGRIVLVAPPSEPARAGLENMARTLSIEWARFGITLTCVARAAGADDEDLAGLVAYLLSPAGDYFSGTELKLGARLPRAAAT